MQRLRLYDCRVSRLANVIGACADDLHRIANAVNTAQRRLLFCKEATDEGWYGTWAEIVFQVSRSAPYITLPREIARIEMMDVCDRPVSLVNQFFEYLQFGNGRMPQCRRQKNCITSAYTRNNAVTFLEMTNAPQYLVAYATDERDYGKRVFFQGLDAGGEVIVTTDVTAQVQGQFVPLNATPAQTPQTFLQIDGIQKDVTFGIVRIYQHDPTTGDEVLLLTMQPGEQVAGYRRYYLDNLPKGCCPGPGSTDDCQVQVTAIAKLELIPVVSDTDYCLITDLEAIINECQSVRYSEMDNPVAQQMSIKFHTDAVRSLNGQLNHYIGKNQVAVGFAPFGPSHLRRQKIGTLW